MPKAPTKNLSVSAMFFHSKIIVASITNNNKKFGKKLANILES